MEVDAAGRRGHSGTLVCSRPTKDAEQTMHVQESTWWNALCK